MLGLHVLDSLPITHLPTSLHVWGRTDYLPLGLCPSLIPEHLLSSAEVWPEGCYTAAKATVSKQLLFSNESTNSILLPSLSAAQFLGSVLFNPLSAAKGQGQAACGLGIGISRRQFSRPWSGEFPGGYPAKVKHEQSWMRGQCSGKPCSLSLLP